MLFCIGSGSATSAPGQSYLQQMLASQLLCHCVGPVLALCWLYPPQHLEVTLQHCKASQLLLSAASAALLSLLYATCAMHQLLHSPWLHCHNSGAILLPLQ